jgi:hypothetical protein
MAAPLPEMHPSWCSSHLPRGPRVTFESWQIGATANAVLTVAYFLIAATILRGLVQRRQLATNRLGAATAAIFATCGIGHGVHLLHVLQAVAAGPAGVAAISHVYDWHLAAVDVVTATVAVAYWSLRSQLRTLVDRWALFPDLEGPRRRAIELNDAVVQELVAARYALDLGELERGRAGVERALDQALDLVNHSLRTEAPAPAPKPLP